MTETEQYANLLERLSYGGGSSIGSDFFSPNMLGSFKSIASGFGTIAGGLINYDVLSAQAALNGTSAAEVGLQAAQQANQLRQNFLDSLGNLQYSAARRGISSESGSIVSNIERSSEALGKDISSLQTSAELRASAIKAQQEVQIAMAEAQRNTSLFGGLLSIGFGVAGLLK